MPAVADLIVFPDVEDLAISVLNTDGRSGVSWYGRVPAARPDEFGRVLRVGGVRETLISDAAELVLEAWAQTDARAVEILNLGRAILAAQDAVLFGCREISGPANLPDPTTDQVRYTLTIQIRVRGARLA